MKSPDTNALWESLRAAAIRYSLCKYGQVPQGLSLTLPSGDAHVEPIRALAFDELNLDPDPKEPKP